MGLFKRKKKPSKNAYVLEYSGLTRHNRFAPYVMVGPAMVFLLLFVFYPMANMVRLSFFDYNLVSDPTFIGLKNYRVLFFVKDDFINALKNTGIYTCGVVVFLISFAVLFALWLEPDSFINRLLQKSMFTPHLVAMLSCAYIWAWIFDQDSGLLNAALAFLNLPMLRWLNDSRLAIWCIVIVSVWKSLGYYLIIMISSLRSIPKEIFEAAQLDNTPPLRKFFKITLPLISPQLFLLLITITISSFKVFDAVSVMTDGGPGNATDTIVTYIYRYAFHMNMKVGYASAAGTILMIILMIATLIYFKMIGDRVYYQ